jgi:hypothetical protein
MDFLGCKIGICWEQNLRYIESNQRVDFDLGTIAVAGWKMIQTMVSKENYLHCIYTRGLLYRVYIYIPELTQLYT